MKQKISKTPHNTTRYIHDDENNDLCMYINNIQDSYFCSHLIKNAADNFYFHLDMFTPKNGITGISSNAISQQSHGDIIKTAIKIGHYTIE